MISMIILGFFILLSLFFWMLVLLGGLTVFLNVMVGIFDRFGIKHNLHKEVVKANAGIKNLNRDKDEEALRQKEWEKIWEKEKRLKAKREQKLAKKEQKKAKKAEKAK